MGAQHDLNYPLRLSGDYSPDALADVLGISWLGTVCMSACVISRIYQKRFLINTYLYRAFLT